jgi:CheY-like chemotaxis protein
MVRLVDDLLEVSRITRGKIELRLELVDVAGIVRTAIETSQPLITAAGHQLAVSLPPEPLTVNADPVRLSQVISNLLNNSAKYTEPGGQIWLTVRRESKGVAICVRDSGIGIAPETLPDVFELFTQVDRQSGRAQGGLGIGLTLVKSLTEMHGGEVSASSPGLGQGSEFIVRLPLAARQTGTSAPRPEDRPRSGVAPQRVLVVDDNRDAAMSMSMLLKCLGSDVRVALNGAEALEAITQYKPAIILLDIGMPGMDGYEVARRIREQTDFDDVTLIALTGWGQDEDRRRSQSAGFDHHLTKPADISALKALLVSANSHE